MQPAQLRNVDLNLLLPLKALLQERNVTRAAERVNLSQSAMSRTLERLRSELKDDLLVRVGRKYELTPRGSALLEDWDNCFRALHDCGPANSSIQHRVRREFGLQ